MDRLPDYMFDHAAVISDDGKYRYSLIRKLTMFGTKGPCVFIMLNPSTADAATDDQTIRKCIHYAKSWRCSELVVVNLFALRSKDPKKLWADETKNPVGPLNDEAILWATNYATFNNGIIICAWGNNGDYMHRANYVMGMVGDGICNYLKWNEKGNQPAHPLYLKNSLTPQAFIQAA